MLFDAGSTELKVDVQAEFRQSVSMSVLRSEQQDKIRLRGNNYTEVMMQCYGEGDSSDYMKNVKGHGIIHLNQWGEGHLKVEFSSSQQWLAIYF